MAVSAGIRLWRTNLDYITFEYARAEVRYPATAELVVDRRGVVHRITPDVPRFPSSVMLQVLPEELFRLNSPAATTRMSALDWIEVCFREQVETALYLHGQSLAPDGAQLTRNLAYKVCIDGIPAELAGTIARINESPGLAEINLTVIEDGIFTDFSDLSTYQPYGYPRSG